jgi:hypothetical protein
VSPAPSEDGKHPAAAPGRRGSENRPGAVAKVALADRLSLRPLAASRIEAFDPVRGEGPFNGQVDDIVDVDVDPPDRPRESSRRWDARLGCVAIPLGPHGRLRVAEIDRADDAPALPPPVGGLIGPEEWLGVDAGDAEPGALDVDPRRDGIVQENDSFSSSATTFDTSR